MENDTVQNEDEKAEELERLSQEILSQIQEILPPGIPIESLDKETIKKAIDLSQPDKINHDTLKYSLLGPSLTKAGQDTVDQRKVSEIIYNASKGSKFFNNEEVRDKNLTVKINKILAQKRQLEKRDLSSDTRRADDLLTQLELSRDLTQHVVHIDCDAFYAAVEELDRPELRDVPFAVGKGVLTTCNYHARKFGCRSGMAGFVAMKLCPQLICLPLNFEKYTSKAHEVREILAKYDPNFESASIDEAYLNITSYCEEHEADPEDVISRMRAEVFEHAKITVSAGIAPNARLAKICSNYNKPNGQYRIPADRARILSFMHELSTRKVNGIGRVFERELKCIGINTCGDIYDHRAYLSKLFGEKAAHFLFNVFLGLGRTRIQPAEDYERKSVGTESTFRDMSDPEELRAKLRKTAEELEGDLARTQFKGRTLVLKIKLHTYEVLSRQTVLPTAANKADELYKHALPMLAKLEKDIPGMKLRLMGLRCTHLVSTKKEDLDFFGMGTSTFLNSRLESGQHTNDDNDQLSEWETLPETEFDDGRDPAGSNGQESNQSPYRSGRRHGREILPNPVPAANSERTQDHAADEQDQRWRCPVCLRPQPADDRLFNEHIDYCLSKSTIQEVVQETQAIVTTGAETHVPRPASTEGTKRKRSHTHDDDKTQPRIRKLFFTSAGAGNENHELMRQKT